MYKKLLYIFCIYTFLYYIFYHMSFLFFFFFFLMIRRPPRSTQDRTLFPYRRSSDLDRRIRDDCDILGQAADLHLCIERDRLAEDRSEEHTSELQSHGLISYADFC